MCKNLVEKGDLDKPLIIFNRTNKRSTDLQAKLPEGKSHVAQSLEKAVSNADIIFTCLGDDPAIKETISTALKSDVKGKLFVDCSTVHPDTTNLLAKSVEDQGAHFVACPGKYLMDKWSIRSHANAWSSVFGAPAMAESGQLVCVLAGPAADVERVKPYCKGVMGRANIDFSDQPQGRATLLKIIGNTFILNMVETLSEGHTLAEKSGLGNDNLHQFIETMFPGPYTAYSGRLMSGDYYKRDEVRHPDYPSYDFVRPNNGVAPFRSRFSSQRCQTRTWSCKGRRRQNEGCGSRGQSFGRCAEAYGF